MVTVIRYSNLTNTYMYYSYNRAIAYKDLLFQGVSREDAKVLLSTGKDFQTYLAGQAGWQEKTKGKDNADLILRPLLKIMCRSSSTFMKSDL